MPRITNPRPTTRTVTEQVLNPAWVEAQKKQVPAGMPVNFGSRDSVAQRQAGITAAQNLPKFITRTRQVAITPPAAPRPAPMPVAPPAIQPRRPLEILVQGSRTQQSAPKPAPKPQSLYYIDPIAFGRASVSQSGDTSVDAQADAAAARASGAGGRIRRY